VGNAIAFSTCNKPFKPLGYLSGRVKSREGLVEMLPTNINFKNIHVIYKKEVSSQQWFIIHERL
jgi:hypothetical protein